MKIDISREEAGAIYDVYYNCIAGTENTRRGLWDAFAERLVEAFGKELDEKACEADDLNHCTIWFV